MLKKWRHQSRSSVIEAGLYMALVSQTRFNQFTHTVVLMPPRIDRHISIINDSSRRWIIGYSSLPEHVPCIHLSMYFWSSTEWYITLTENYVFPAYDLQTKTLFAPIHSMWLLFTQVYHRLPCRIICYVNMLFGWFYWK